MKKLFTKLLLIIVVIGFASSAPCSVTGIKSALIRPAIKTEKALSTTTEPGIHPLDIMNIKFN
jgi:hypothetical protein